MSKVDWKDIELKDACNIVSGGTPSRDDSTFWNGDIPWVTPTDITANKKKFLSETAEKITVKGFKSSATRMLPKGAILLTSRASLGFASIAGLEVTTNQGFKSLVCREEYDNEYFYYYVDHSLRSQMEALACGSTFLEISKKDMERLKVHIPKDKKFQKKISKILSCVDLCIVQTEETISKLQKIKTGLMQDLFTRGVDANGELRPSYQEKPELYKQSPLGMIPREWTTSTLKSLSISGLQNGYFKSPELVGSGHKLVNVTDIYQDFGIDITLSSVERVRVPDKEYKKYSLTEGDIVFTRSSLVLEGIAHCNIVKHLPGPAVFECHVMRLRPDKKKVLPLFLAAFCRMPKARSYLMSIAKQVTMATVSQPDVEKMIVAYPEDLVEQEIISKRIEDFDLALKAEENLRAKMLILKQGLLQDLLTGRVEVKVGKDE